MNGMYDYIWFFKKWRGDRKGNRCRVLARGRGRGPRNVMVEFEDGEVITGTRFCVRKILREGVK